MKTIEIKGIGFPNKGAELLLNAILKQYDENNNRICTEPYSPYRYKVIYPLYTKTRIGFKGVNVLKPLEFSPKYILDRFGFIKSSEVDLILDASGYAYGDPWELKLAKNRILDEKNKAKTVLLPQSLGPFTTSDSKLVAKKLADKCELIYAREQTGADYFQEITGRKLEVIPDITFGLEVPVSKISYDIIIIPNFQVFTREGNKYLDVLFSMSKLLINNGRTITFMNHEGDKDRDICLTLQNRLLEESFDVQIIEPSRGIEAKSIISASKFVITSRYHGLISSLSTQTPCLPIGWSFKYNDIMSTFNIETPKNLVDCDSYLSYINSVDFVNYFKSDEYKNILNSVKNKVSNMWSQINDVNN